MHDSDDNDINPVDRRVVAAQIGREPRALHGVAVRCVYDMPAVTRQAPTDDSGNPFPTAYYLTCPHLVRQVDRIESGGGVKRFEAAMAVDSDLHAATREADRRHAAIDDRSTSIAGADDPLRLKCLHAHVAFALAEGDHPLGEAVLREASPRWCEDARCRGLAGTADLSSNPDHRHRDATDVGEDASQHGSS